MYNYYQPKENIRNTIHAIWQVDHQPAFVNEYIIPKGIVEIIFNLGDQSPIPAQQDNKTYQLPNCFINGFNRNPIQLQLPERQTFFGVLFQPLAIRKIFGIPGSEFSDITVDLTLLDSDFHTLWQQLGDIQSFDERVVVFLDWLKRTFIDWLPQEQMINQFLYDGDQFDVTVKELANSICYSPRHLSRKIFEATGMNTEEILHYKKYQRAVHLIHHTELSLTAVAYQSLFSDQSHFIRSFKTYTKMTPGEYRKSKSLLKGHVYENVR